MFTFYSQMYSTTAVILFSILTWSLVLSYRAIGDRIKAARSQFNDAFQRDFSRNLHEWATWIDLVDQCSKLMNHTFGVFLFVEIISIFLRILSMSINTWSLLNVSLVDIYLAYNVPTIMKYLLHLWLICFPIETSIREVRS